MTSLVANASVMSFRISSDGSVQLMSDRFYSDGSAYWRLDDLNNTFGVNSSANTSLNFSSSGLSIENQFSIADITDVTWARQTDAFVITDSGSFQISNNGSVQLMSDRFYSDGSAYWRLNDLNNTFGINSSANTSLNFTSSGISIQDQFSISDIINVTWARQSDAFVETNTGSYRISSDGSVQVVADRFYSDGSAYWRLDDQNNTFGINSSANRTLNFGSSGLSIEDQFSISDIQDVTWARQSDAFVLVQQSAVTVDSPSSQLLVFAGLALFAAYRRKPDNKI
ncbi:hypothetical protein KUL49_02910 [Alteromonas sp. KUL49]|nr:hypothetical protein KUL49_02910 [Alteromonas sp. KUL49]